jgi:ribosomal protein L22
MTDEEKEAIEHFEILNEIYTNSNYNLDFKYTESEYDNSKILLNLIQKQEKEIEKKDKIIDLMSERIQEDSKWFYSDFKFNAKSQEEIKQYFEELVENGR